MLRPALMVGGLMTVVGAFVVYGAVTGNLAAMLAAIFDPGAGKYVGPAGAANALGSAQNTKTISPSGGRIPNVLGAHR